MTVDAVVVGAGPAGVAAALTLARSGRSVALAHGGAGAAHRVESLPGAARPLLRDLGLLAVADRHPPGHGAASVWGSAKPARRDTLFDPHGTGWRLDRARFDPDARAEAVGAGVAVLEGRAHVARDGDGWRVAVGGATVRARFAVDASGRAAVVARAAGVARRRFDRVVAVVRLTRGGAPDGWTRVEAVPDGWWVTAAAGDLRMTAFHTDAARLDRDLLTPSGFAAARAEAAWLDAAVPTDAEPLGPPRGLDAGSAELAHAAGPGWLAVGDAALSVDPLSSQGHLNALYSGLRGGQAAAAALAGDASATAAYADRMATVRATYLAHRDAFYGAERRWPDAPFWAARIGVSVASG